MEHALAIFLDALAHFFQSYTAVLSSDSAQASSISAMAASQSGLPLGLASSASAGGTLAHLSARRLDASAHLDQSKVFQSVGAQLAFMSSIAASHSGDLASGAPKTLWNMATRSMPCGPSSGLGPGCGPHFSNTSSNSSAHSCLRTSNLARAWSLVIFPASNASLMARIFVAHSALTSATSSTHFLTHGGLGPCGCGPHG